MVFILIKVFLPTKKKKKNYVSLVHPYALLDKNTYAGLEMLKYYGLILQRSLELSCVLRKPIKV